MALPLSTVSTNFSSKDAATGRGPLATYKRTLTRTESENVSQESGALGEEDWPPSPPAKRHQSGRTLPPLGKAAGSSLSADRSSAHWGAKGAGKHAKDTLKPKAFPWDPPARSNAARRDAKLQDGTTAFQKLPSTSKVGAESGVNLLTSSTLNIKQKVILSPEQQKILKMVAEDGKNIFFTGSAGTGKSVLLREIIHSLRQKFRFSRDAVAVTASTGMAACNIGGTTLHSFAGIGLGKEDPQKLLAKVRKNVKTRNRWNLTQVLVIDEVSMVEGDLLDKLDYIARQLKKKPDKPFGGIQLVFTGDFFQLPPVGSVKFAFEAKSWKEGIHHTVNLTQVFRQKDGTFITMLNEMRIGALSEESIKRFKALVRVPVWGEYDPTDLFPLRAEVARSNMKKLNMLPGKAHTFRSSDIPGKAEQNLEPDQMEKLLENIMAPKVLVLREGCQVMCIKNDSEKGLINGTVGRVVRISRLDDLAATDQGATVEGEEPPKDVPSGDLVPWVVWQYADGRINQTPLPIERVEFKIENAYGELRAKRVQFPLILAWAMSIHKSQGQTIDRVRVDLGQCFEAGQAYVALSRATSLDLLQVNNFDPSKVRCHRKVIEWNRTLETLS